MIERGKISALQLGKMMYLAITPTAILTAPGISFTFARQDLWLTPIWAFSGIIAILTAYGLHRLYPGSSFIRICSRVTGRLPGAVIGGVYWLFYLYISGIILREYGEFVVGAFLSDTPLIVVLGSLMLVCALAVRGGVEIVGRFAELFLPAFILLFLLIVLLITPDLHITYMMPILGEGLLPSIEGSLVLQIWFGEMFTAAFLLPFVSDQANAQRSLWLSFIAIIVTLMTSNWVALLLLGELTGGYTFPFLILARYINLAEFFAHLETLFMAIWVLGAFVKMCVFFYATVLGTAEWMQLSDYRPIVFPLAFLLTLFGIWVAPNYQELTHVISTSMIPAAVTMFVLVPVVLYGIARTRRMLSR